MKKKIVPMAYFQEMANEYARSWAEAKAAPGRQRKRIDAVLASDSAYETMSNGRKISLKKLLRFHKEAKRVDTEMLRKRWVDFIETHEGNKDYKEQLIAAKRDAKQFATQNPHYNDTANNYDLFHELSHKYYLSEKRMDRLMVYMMKLNLMS